MNDKPQAERRPVVELSARLVSSMKRNHGGLPPIAVTLRLIKGPCTDDWCQPIRRLEVTFVEGGKAPASAVPVEAGSGAIVYFDERIYDSVRKSRSRIIIDTAPFGRMKVTGLASGY